MKKAVILLLASILLSGCGSQINLTDEQSGLVAEYAAGLLLKYDKNYQERLLTDPELVEADAKEALEEQKKKDFEAFLENERQKSIAKNSAGSDKDKETDAVSIYQSLKEVLSMDAFEVSYTGYEVADSYPNKNSEINDGEEVTEELYPVIDAAAGKKLLVLKFNVANSSESPAKCDVLNLSPRFQATVNGEKNINSLMTMLLNDLSTLNVELEAGASMEAVLIFQSTEEVLTDIQTIGVTIKRDSDTFKTELQ